MTNVRSEFLEKRLAEDQRLLDTIKAHLPELEKLLSEATDACEDGIYRFYHHSFKVYGLQNYTFRSIALFRTIGREIEKTLCKWFEDIVEGGTGAEFQLAHNENWLQHTRPIVEAFLHAKYFLEMMVKTGREMVSASVFLPSGWAAILTLYGQR